MNLATRIRIARRKSGMSQKTMAEELCVSRGAVANWEGSGRSRPSLTNLCKIAAITGVTVEWLARGNGLINFTSAFDISADTGSRIVSNDIEARLLSIFRLAPEGDRASIMKIIDSIANLHS